MNRWPASLAPLRTAALAVAIAVLPTAVATAQPDARAAAPALADELLAAVVSISTSERFEVRDEELDGLGDILNEDLPLIQGLGSGFVIDPEGIIVTNNHVIADADEIIVAFDDGSELMARVVGRDPATDVAVLRVNPPRPLAAVSFGSSEAVAIGDWVMAIGNPWGFGGTVTLGILSARGRDLLEGPYDNFLQTDAAINLGSSGGPLFDIDGNVIGINSAIVSSTGESMGVAFAIPSEMVERVVAHLLEYGYVRRGYLGVRIQEVTPGLAEGFGLERARGALVAEIIPDTPAAATDIRVGDIIVGFDDAEIAVMRDLPRNVAATDIGTEVELRVLRNGETVSFRVAIAELPNGGPVPIPEAAQPAAPPETISSVALGLNLSPVTPDLRAEFGVADDVEGLMVVSIKPDSLAFERPVLEGDIIVGVAGDLDAPFASIEDLDAALADALAEGRSAVALLLARPDGETRFEWVPLSR